MDNAIDLVSDISNELLLSEIPRVEDCVRSAEISYRMCNEILGMVEELPNHDVELLQQARASEVKLNASIEDHKQLLAALKSERLRRGL